MKRLSYTVVVSGAVAVIQFGCAASSCLGAETRVGGPSREWRVSADSPECCPSIIQIGTRATYFFLTDNKRDVMATSTEQGSFYGSITDLKDVQNLTPLKVFVDVNLTPYVALELTWDQVRADTITRLDGHNDGTLDLTGPILCVLGRYPNCSSITPYGGAGVAYLSGDFHDEYHWHYALDPETGVYNNGPSWSQTFVPDSSFGFVLCAGLSIHLAEGWDLDLYGRHLRADITGVHIRMVSQQVAQSSDFSIPMNNIAAGLGIRWSF